MIEAVKSKIKYYLEKLLTAVRARSIVGGLEISNSTVRLAYFDGRAWHLGGVRLEPGIMEDGKIRDRDRFVEALKSVKLQVFGKKYESREVSIVASLSSISIYSQVFGLPMIKGENLDKAIQLNIQMVSPVDISQTYPGWQVVGEDQRSSRLEVLSAFIDRSIVDELNRAMLDSGFLLAALESKMLSLSRLLREQAVGVNIDQPYIMVSLDDSGLDFLIIRHGQPYFEYFNPWREIVDEKGQIGGELFGVAITRSLYQILNFYGQHWPEAVSEVVISATALKDEIEKIVKASFPFTVKELKLKIGEAIGPEWFVSLSCGIRGSKPRGKDKEMSLMGIGAEEEFKREQFAAFASFWKFLMPVSLGLIAAVLFLSDLFFIQTKSTLESQPLFHLSNTEAQENQSLQTEAGDFDRTVSLIRAVQKGEFVKSNIIEKVDKILKDNSISAERFYLQSIDAPLVLRGAAKSEDQLASFKKALESEPLFKGISLPLSGLETKPEGVTFSMTFSINSR